MSSMPVTCKLMAVANHDQVSRFDVAGLHAATVRAEQLRVNRPPWPLAPSGASVAVRQSCGARRVCRSPLGQTKVARTLDIGRVYGAGLATGGLVGDGAALLELLGEGAGGTVAHQTAGGKAGAVDSSDVER